MLLAFSNPLYRSSRNYTGNFAIDEDILKEEGLANFDQYACVPGARLLPDFFLVSMFSIFKDF